MTCPECAEDVPVSSTECPECGESLVRHMPPEHLKAVLDEQMAAIDKHLASDAAVAGDRRLRGGVLTAKGIVALVLTLASLGMMVAGFGGYVRGDDGDALAGFGVMIFLPSVIAAIVALVNDLGTAFIQTAGNPARAYRRYFTAIQTNRTGRAYAALTPKARKSGRAEAVEFNTIPGVVKPGGFSITSLASFKEYWQHLFRKPGYSRAVRLQRVRKVEAKGRDLAMLEVNMTFHSTSYWALLLLPLGLLPVLLMQKTEKKTINKLMIRRSKKWFVAESEFEGRLDRVSL